jgi:flagellar hook-basal body complex protein FliE
MSPLQAAKAYAAAQGAAVAPSPKAAAVPGEDFAAMLQQAMGEAVQVSRAAETQMSAQAQGRAELVDVVTAVAQAEVSLETVVSIRDQMINAYQEIMRMPI